MCFPSPSSPWNSPSLPEGHLEAYEQCDSFGSQFFVACQKHTEEVMLYRRQNMRLGGLGPPLGSLTAYMIPSSHGTYVINLLSVKSPLTPLGMIDSLYWVHEVTQPRDCL